MIELNDLNSSQKEAVKHIDGALLILAGAGSGKTKTITTRLAYLISLGIDPANTLTLTFTNKSATEMRNRALGLIQNSYPYPPLLCTFHKFGLMFLRFNIHLLTKDNKPIYNNNFIVIDTDDKKSIIKNINKKIEIFKLTNSISRFKNIALSPKEVIKLAKDDEDKLIANIYFEYQKYLEENNLLDFDDLLYLTYKILDENNQICTQTSQKYQYIMVDEYQDTNDIQYMILMKLCSTHNNICVVGDDDQSIYGWRGANIDNILNFENEFRNVKRVKLEENYRSTQNILDCANTLIKNNSNRLGKNLKSTKEKGKEIEVISFDDEKIEAKNIANKIKNLNNNGVNPNEIAILFRVNALSRVLETELTKNYIPFKLIGGVRFYERAEIKDLIAYFRLLINGDDFSLMRIINKPKRGLGKVSIEKLENLAISNNITIYEAISNPEVEQVLSKKAINSLREFKNNIEYLKDKINEPMNFIYEFESVIKLKEFYSNTTEAIDRIGNIDEFYGLFKDFIKNNPDQSIFEFLNDLALQSDQDQIEGENIFMMSIHASKGLEFEHVFIVGCDDGFFPLLSTDIDLEEERRLAYVAITRAKNELTFSSSKSRFYRGSRTTLRQSSFIKEFQKVKIQNSSKHIYNKNDLVKHSVFGMGKVEEVLLSSSSIQKLKINFGGIRRDILASFIKPIE
jgi:DNA helicase-2/ATP-dependent DNA helicase PcrA